MISGAVAVAVAIAVISDAAVVADAVVPVVVAFVRQRHPWESEKKIPCIPLSFISSDPEKKFAGVNAFKLFPSSTNKLGRSSVPILLG
jgi:hypothetical protein